MSNNMFQIEKSNMKDKDIYIQKIIKQICIFLLLVSSATANAASISEIKKDKNLTIAIMVAYQNDLGIGVDGHLPWKLKDDLKHFKSTTVGHSVLMGRRTYEAIGHPLIDRRNIVISSTMNDTPGVEIFKSVEDALIALKNNDIVFIIGGTKLFEIFLPYADILYRTLVNSNMKVDTYCPKIDLNNWNKISEVHVDINQDNEFDYLIETFNRKEVE